MKAKKGSNLSYVDTLTYDKNYSHSLSGRYLSNVRLMVVLFLSLAVLGIVSIVSLPKTLNPEIDIPFFVITATLPGGSSNDVEQLLTQPIESELKQVQGVDTYTSVSQENVSITTIEFSAGVLQEKARSDLQAALDQASVDFPDDASDPNLSQLDFENVPVWTFALAKNGSAMQESASLTRISETLIDAVESTRTIQNLEVSGQDQRQIQVVLDPTKVAQFDLNPNLVSQAVSEALSSYPAGTVVSNQTGYSVSIDQPAVTLSKLRQLSLEIEGQRYSLNQIAQVFETSEPNSVASVYQSKNEPATEVLVFSAFKTRAARIDTARAEMQTVLDQVLADYPADIKIISIQDYADEINNQIFDLVDNFWQTLLLIFLSMLALYGIRQSIIASLAIPAALLIVFTVMNVAGFTLNFLSIYSLLVALGLFTDNAVVVIQGFTDIYRSGRFTAYQATVLTWREYAVEILTINILTCWAFLPLLTLDGIIGEFIKPMPIIVSTSMMASVAAALLFTLPMMMILVQGNLPSRVKSLLKVVGLAAATSVLVLIAPKSPLVIAIIPLSVLLIISIYILRQPLKTSLTKHLFRLPHSTKRDWRYPLEHGFIKLDPLISRYQRVMSKVIGSSKYRKQVFISTLLVCGFGYVLLLTGMVKNEFFPASDTNRIYVHITLPPGITAQATLTQTQPLLSALSKVEHVDFVTLEVGKSAPQGFDLTQARSNDVLFTLFLGPSDNRPSAATIGQEVREITNNVTVGEVTLTDVGEGGPPAGAAIDIAFQGEDLDQLLTYANQTKLWLEELPGATNVETSVTQDAPKLVFTPDPAKLDQFNLSYRDIGGWLRQYLTGIEVKDANFPTQEYPIVVKLSDDLVQANQLDQLTLPTDDARVPLAALGQLALASNPSAIYHQEGIRSVSVTASALPGFNPVSVNQQLVAWVDQELALTDEYTYVVGGSNEVNAEANQGIFLAMGVSAILILATMVVSLGSFRKAFIVMLLIPIAISGVLIFFALTATPVSLPAMIGLLSLFGIVIANSLMIVDKVTKNLAVGFDFSHALTEGAASRIEPILLTSAAQVIGLLPATLADPIWRGFGGAIIAGMSFSVVVMLLFVPVVYYYLFPELHPAKNLKRS